jgi:hypothetical protein
VTVFEKFRYFSRGVAVSVTEAAQIAIDLLPEFVTPCISLLRGRWCSSWALLFTWFASGWSGLRGFEWVSVGWCG